MKRFIAIFMVIALAAGLTGCDALQKKFTRKKKVTKAPRIFQEKKYEIKPTPELYEKHFAYWQSWSSEIIQRLGDNHKKDVRCVEEIIGQLNDMRKILVPEMGDKLSKHIKRYEEVRDTLNRNGISSSNDSSLLSTMQSNNNTLLSTLEREDRIIGSEFCISKVKNYIRQSFDDAPAQGSSGASADGG